MVGKRKERDEKRGKKEDIKEAENALHFGTGFQPS
jgi:hypothetical protein